MPHIKKTYQYYNDNRLKFSADARYQFDRSFKYDFMGRLSEARTGVEARGEPVVDRDEIPYKQDYAYNVFGNVTARNTFTWSQANNQTHSWTNGRESTWGYDADGRMISTPENRYYYDAAGSLVMTTHSTNRRTIQHLDGEGKPARQDQYSYYNNQYNLQQSEYFIYSSVLGKLLTEVKSTGAKKRTFVYGIDGVVALQQYSGTTPEVRWEHTDPGNSTYLQTSSGGEMYYNSQAELDPLGSNVGKTSPFTQQNAVQNAPLGSWGYGSFGDAFGNSSCRVDGFEYPPSYCRQVLSVGGGYIVPLGAENPFVPNGQGKFVSNPLYGNPGWSDYQWRCCDNSGNYYPVPTAYGSRSGTTTNTFLANSFGPQQNTGRLTTDATISRNISPRQLSEEDCNFLLNHLFGSLGSVVASAREPKELLQPRKDKWGFINWVSDAAAGKDRSATEFASNIHIEMVKFK